MQKYTCPRCETELKVIAGDQSRLYCLGCCYSYLREALSGKIVAAPRSGGSTTIYFQGMADGVEKQKKDSSDSARANVDKIPGRCVNAITLAVSEGRLTWEEFEQWIFDTCNLGNQEFVRGEEVGFLRGQEVGREARSRAENIICQMGKLGFLCDVTFIPKYRGAWTVVFAAIKGVGNLDCMASGETFLDAVSGAAKYALAPGYGEKGPESERIAELDVITRIREFEDMFS